MVRNVPCLALIPPVIRRLGIGEEVKVFLVTPGTFFPIYLDTAHGVRTVDPHLVEMAAAYGMSSGRKLRRVVLPGALPSIFVGLRYGPGITWPTLIVAETIASTSAIGYVAMNAREFMLVNVVAFTILRYAAPGKLADLVVRLLERRCLQRNRAYRRI